MMRRLALSSLLLVSMLAIGTAHAAPHDQRSHLDGFELIPGSLIQVDFESAIGLERNPATRESALVIYTVLNPDECLEVTCLLLATAFIIYDKQGNPLAIYGEPDSPELEHLLFLVEDFVRT